MNDFPTFGAQDSDVESTREQVGNEETVLDALRSALKEETTVPAFRLAVPNRPSIELEFNPDIEYDLLRRFMKSAARNKAKEFNPLAFAYSVLSKTNVGVYINGRQAHDAEGTPLTVVHAELRAMLGAVDTVDAIRRLYGVDGHIIAAANRVVEEAGYNEDDMEGDSPLGG